MPETENKAGVVSVARPKGKVIAVSSGENRGKVWLATIGTPGRKVTITSRELLNPPAEEEYLLEEAPLSKLGPLQE